MLLFYRQFNPYEHDFFPKCPLYQVSGYQCPGCGSQRALHHLTHGDWRGALGENFLLVVGIPYLVLGFFLEWMPVSVQRERLKSRLYGATAALIALVVIVGWWILRNVI